MWRTDTSVASRGSSSAGKLSGEERKAFHKGQFFTPDAAAQLMWRIASRAMTGERSYSVADFSVGSGQLIQYCQPQTHTLFLADVDQSNLDSLRKDLSRAGFDYNLSYKGMQSVRASGLNVGLLNPPFNLDLRDDRLNADYASVSVNKALGNKSAPSQRYAVEQALDACEVVVALLPITDITALYNGHWKPNGVERLCGLVTLPRDLFAAEKTLVSTGLAVFGRTGQDVGPGWFEYSAFCPYDLVGDFSLVSAKPEFAEISKSRLPVATMPATGIKAVTLTRKGRRIVPAFQCGQVEEQVLGAILRAPVHEFQNQQSSLRTHYARTTQYIGQGQLDIEAWLRGPGISEAMANLESVVRNAGGEPTWAPGLVAYLQKRERQHKVASTATRHWTYYPAPVTDTPPTATVRKIFPLDPAALLTPTLDKGAQVTAVASAGGYKITLADGSSHEVAPERFAEHFCFDEPDGHQESSRGGEWTLSAEGRPAHFPEQAAAIQGEAVKRGVDRLLTWDFQMHGLVEALMTRTGQVMAWEMGLGKGRLALALALMGGKHSLIMVEPYLVDELAIEITDFGLADDEWQVIERPEDARDLKRINIITYNRLRQPLQMIANATPAQKRRARTYADLLAKRISIAVADEGSLLAHESTAQSRAIAKLHPKRRYILDGTPNANYPRDALPLMTWVAGDSTALQQYGRWHYSLDERAYKSAAYLEQGRTEFSRRFVTLSMGSHEDGSEFRSEIPMIQDVIGYRQWLAPLVSRRLQGEPEVARHVQIEPPLARKVVLKWDRDHFSHYHRVSTDFSRFYESQLRLRVEEGKNINFAVTLARVGACVRAANMPQLASSNFARLDSPATTKQRYAAARSIELAEAGEKVIVYVDGPEQVERLCDLIRAQGHDVVGLHGQMAIKRRTRALNEQFRFGPVMILVASIQCCRRGLNIHQASRVIMYSRHWSYSTERQAIFRTCRPLQTRQVRAEFLELQGSIDEYQNQVVMYKRECEQVGLDWATPTLTEDRFMHMDTLFSTFCQDLASLGESLVFSADDQDLVLTEEPEFVY